MSEAFDNRVQVHSLVDAVTERIEAAIMNGQLAPGTKISEQALAQSLGVSRGPLREAIRRLEGRKLIERTPNIGVRIAELNNKDLRELLVVREALECQACRLAAVNMSDEEISALQQLVVEHGAHEEVPDTTGYHQGLEDLDFHIRIVKGSGNERLLSMLCTDLYDLMRFYRYKLSIPRCRTPWALDDHKAIVDALAARNPDLADSAMRKHIMRSRAQADEELAAGGAASPA
jgi:DNA-binding GntR family transcriptional regulator